MITMPAPSLPTGSATSTRACSPAMRSFGMTATALGLSAVPTARTAEGLAGPRSKMMSDGLSGAASIRIKISSAAGSGTSVSSRNSSRRPSEVIFERSSRPCRFIVAHPVCRPDPPEVLGGGARERRAVPSGQSVSRETTPILARCHAGALAKGSREIRLRRKVQCDSSVEQGLIPSSQKHLRALKTVPAHVLMRRFTNGGCERSRKVELAQGGNFREPGDREIPSFQICVDVFPHSGQSASVESPVRELLEIFVGGETAMTMHQPRCQSHRQRFGQHPATGGLGPHLRNNRERDLGKQRGLETELTAQGSRR